MPDTPRKQIGNYELLEPIGDGAEGRVFKAVCVADAISGVSRNEVVALKWLRQTGHEKAPILFERQTAILRGLDHPNIVRYKDSFIWRGHGEWGDDVFCLVTELLQGETLKALVERHPNGLPWEQARAIYLQVLAALRYATGTGRGVIHRDLKLSNIFITHDAVVKLFDFGIARHSDGSATSTSTEAGLKGTFDYMAPDFVLLSDGFRGDQQSDIYSLGICLHQTLTGRLPFPPLGENSFIGYVKRWSSSELPEPEFRHDVFRVLGHARSVIARCLETDRAKRFQTFDELERDFARIGWRKLEHRQNTYEFVEFLGRGGFGEVFRARRVSDGANVAVKRLLTGRYAKRFIKEAKILQQASHPHLVRYVDFVELRRDDEESRYYLVLEYLPGMPEASLRYRIKEAKHGLPVEEALRIFDGYLDCLEYLHNLHLEQNKGIIHRDIKPANLYAPRDNPEAAKIFDLGIAHDESGTQTHGRLPGTPDYMPPEFAESDPEKRGSPQSDLYSLGVSLYETLTGKLPWERATGGDQEVWLAYIKRSQKPVALNFDHPVFRDNPRLVDLVQRCLAHRPKDRFASAKEMRAVVARLLEGFQRVLRHGGEEYRFLDRQPIGQGGFAKVYRAVRQSDGRSVAIKELTQAQYAARFVREARILREAPPHPHLVEYLDFIEKREMGESRYYLVLEYLEGMPGATLKDRIRRNRHGLPVLETLQLFQGYLACLRHLHEMHDEEGKGVFHRDIKPANLYAPEGSPGGAKIFDLGIALDQKGTKSVGAGMPGTPDYMPPEFGCIDKPESASRGSAQSDLFSLGVSLYEALTGQLPLPSLGDGTKVWPRYFKRADDPSNYAYTGAFARPIFGEYPGLQRLLQRAMAYHPAERYPTASAMATDVAQVLSDVERQESAKAETERAQRTAIAEAEALRKQEQAEQAANQGVTDRDNSLTHLKEAQQAAAQAQAAADRVRQAAEAAEAAVDSESARGALQRAVAIAVEVEAFSRQAASARDRATQSAQQARERVEEVQRLMGGHEDHLSDHTAATAAAGNFIHDDPHGDTQATAETASRATAATVAGADIQRLVEEFRKSEAAAQSASLAPDLSVIKDPWQRARLAAAEAIRAAEGAEQAATNAAASASHAEEWVECARVAWQGHRRKKVMSASRRVALVGVIVAAVVGLLMLGWMGWRWFEDRQLALAREFADAILKTAPLDFPVEKWMESHAQARAKSQAIGRHATEWMELSRQLNEWGRKFPVALSNDFETAFQDDDVRRAGDLLRKWKDALAKDFPAAENGGLGRYLEDRNAIVGLRQVVITSDPPGTEFILHGIRVGQSSWTTNVPVGTRLELTARHPYLGEQHKSVPVGKSRELYQQRFSFPYGQVLIRCDMRDAKVTLGGYEVGATPMSEGAIVNTGMVTLVVQKGGYRGIVTLNVQQGERITTNAVLELMQGRVSLASDPSGAEVYSQSKLLGRTPMQSTLDIGTYDLQARYPGLENQSLNITVQPDQTLPVKFEFPYGSARLDSQPTGVEAWFDGQPVGKTPYHGRYLRPGKHQYELRSILHEGQGEITVVAGQVETNLVSLDLRSGSVALASDPPGAEIWHNDKRVGVTPADVRLVVPQQQLVVKYPGLEDKTVTVPVLADQPSRTNVVFEYGAVSISSEPSGATVLLNGQPMGRTPYINQFVRTGITVWGVNIKDFVPTNLALRVANRQRTDAVVPLRRGNGFVSVSANFPGVMGLVTGDGGYRRLPAGWKVESGRNYTLSARYRGQQRSSQIVVGLGQTNEVRLVFDAPQLWTNRVGMVFQLLPEPNIWLGMAKVTRSQFARGMGQTPPGNDLAACITDISFKEAHALAAILTKADLPQGYTAASYRLPTTKQWRTWADAVAEGEDLGVTDLRSQYSEWCVDDNTGSAAYGYWGLKSGSTPGSLVTPDGKAQEFISLRMIIVP